MYEVLFSDWFIINIKEHTNMTDLYNLKLTNKYFHKNITKKVLEYCMYKIIENQTPIITISEVNTNKNDKYFYINMPTNTLIKFQISGHIILRSGDLYFTIKGHMNNIFDEITMNYEETPIFDICQEGNKMAIFPIPNIKNTMVITTQINF